MKLASFVSKPTSRRVHGDDFVESLDVGAAPGVYIALYLSDILVSRGKSITPLFETNQNFIFLTLTLELEKEVSQHVYFTSNEKEHCIKIVSVRKDSQLKQF